MKRVKVKMNRASYPPVLMAVMARTSGDVLELGSGLYSTTYLHYECLRTGRNLLTCEHDTEFYEYIIKAITPWHRCELGPPSCGTSAASTASRNRGAATS